MSVLAEAEEVGKFIVEFYNPANHLLHSAVPVVCAAAHAVEAAIDIVARDYHEDVSRHRPSIKFAHNGEGVPGFEDAFTKADLYRQLQEIQRKLATLDDDGSTKEQKAAVKATLPNPNQNVTAPATFNFNPGEVGPTPSNEPPQSIPVQAPTPASGPMSQAAIDARIAERQQEAGPAV